MLDQSMDMKTGLIGSSDMGLIPAHFDDKGEAYFHRDQVTALVIDRINAVLPKNMGILTGQADEASAALAKWSAALRDAMNETIAQTKVFLTDLRQTRFAVVAECGDMIQPLREVRQFFLGHDYKEQIDRLKEFVDLCERLQKLKDSGFMDRIADTLIQLDRD